MLDHHELAQRQIEETFGKCIEEMCQIRFLNVSLPPLYDGGIQFQRRWTWIKMYHNVPIMSSSITKLNNCLSVQFHPLEILIQIEYTFCVQFVLDQPQKLLRLQTRTWNQTDLELLKSLKRWWVFLCSFFNSVLSTIWLQTEKI